MKSNNAFQKRIFCLLLTLTCLIVPGYAQQWELVWSDEFEVDGLPDAAKWGYDVGGNGWGNQELQYYTEGRMENARVEDGHLIIEALRESFGGREYTSARLVTRGKGDWTYGRVEVRAKLPAGRGTWPAIWMLPTEGIYGDGGWPDNGEIDIMEHVGFDPENIHGTVHTEAYNHTKGTQRGGSRQVPGALDEFHDYAVEWSPTRIEFMIDDVVYFRFFNENSGWEAWPFDRPFHLLLNIAVGGSWGGLQGIDDTVFPARMEVDYVRVYENTAVPEVTMTAPASADVGASVTLDAEAAVREGNIARVEFMQGDAVLAVVDEAPYAFTVNDLEEGCYTVSARATSNTGWSTLSDASSLTVGSAMDPSNCPQAPYLMAAHPVPGKIEVEHFDLGGRGVAYLDLDTENQGNAIRTDEGVDIQATSDAGGGYSVGWIASREWLQYTVNVETEGTYTLEARVASPSEGGSLQVEVDGTNISGSVEFGQQGGGKPGKQFELKVYPSRRVNR